MFPIILSVIAVIISAYSAIYAGKLFAIEKAKYNFDKERYERELEEELAKQRPLILVRSTQLQDHLMLRKRRHEAADVPVFRSGVIHSKRANRFYRLFGIPSFDTSIDDTVEKQMVDLIGVTVSAQVVIANRGETPFYISSVGMEIRSRPQLPSFLTFNKRSLIGGYIQWYRGFAERKKTVTASQGFWYGYDFLILGCLLNRKWFLSLSAPRVENPITLIAENYSTHQPISFDPPIQIVPSTHERWFLWSDITPQAIKFLSEYNYYPFSIKISVMYEDGNVSKESIIQHHFYSFRDIEFDLNSAFADITWKR